MKVLASPEVAELVREPPDELHLEAKGWRSKRIEAYWNGCVWADQ